MLVTEIQHTTGRPSDSLTDLAAAEAFKAIDRVLKAGGEEPSRSFQVVMVLVPDGDPNNATVASSLPNGDTDPEHLLSHALTQLQVLASECGVRITATRNAMN